MDWPTVDAELLALLPPLLKAVVKALGFLRAREWLELRGGVNVNIPAHKEEAIGLTADELARLRHTMAPHMDAAGRVWMPKVDKLWRFARNAAICSTVDSQSISHQARQYRLSSRQITNIRREGGAEDEQMDLF
ncbi:MAG: hypothetical protein WBK19_16285 [Azonexus sp.]